MNDPVKTSVSQVGWQQETVCLNETASGAARAAAPPGYELLGEIGHGGMGVVYRARDRTLQRELAVKLLQEHYAGDAGATRRFVEESAITAQLQHPAIPAIYQVGSTARGRPFLAMKLIRGRTLGELLMERADPAADHARFIAVFEQIAHAVAYAHSRDVIHRDQNRE